MANNLGKLQTLVLDCCFVFKLGLQNILSRCEDVEVILSSCFIVTSKGHRKIATRGGKHFSFSIKKITKGVNTTMYCLMNGEAKREFTSLKLMLDYLWMSEENPTLPNDEEARARRKRARMEIQSMVADYHSCQH
ncbi:hypothetical protein FRX31_021422 [Thalictrum thalictroides]|uniref:Uncharacterized protein n=1 Tax=Thalictrum thalictroides TaxID=46969 RepID=A0A7J6VXF2_THATH|nr:hypothetical protein FRX31_021422 [Thalictrum thalictroides]